MKTFAIDIDGTICEEYKDGDEIRPITNRRPYKDRIDKINKLYDEGNIITYWTARGSSQPDNIGRLDKYKALTISQLDKWSCKYHDVQLGNKPQFDLFIDDKAKRIEEI